MIGWLLALPALCILGLAFLWPLAALFRISLNRTLESGAMEVAVTGESYARLLGDDFTWQLVRDTLVLSASSSAVAVMLALPVALMVRAASPRWRGLLALMGIAPLLISGTARLVGWMAILGDQGMINVVLQGIGITDAPLRMINNWTGVRIGLVESLMPYAVLVLLAGLGRLDSRLEEAAATLGANRVQTFFRVTLPLAAPVLLAAWLLDLVLGISAFITPKLMGGGRVFVLATEIYDLALESVNWPAAAALAMLLLGGLLTLMLARLAFGWTQGRRA
ncbi:ABC transporter permease [Roseomonas marmotae]|uniref:ABC transporter permease n=1 Tax=Roseomonas marmotae TaxID=2768161 RepID=A0ABS3KGE4_9PROT|nr:ABC transporter permease [Roseomonas marmotae]MBO1076544.1 ABC transporter permease [Roseomonas marmotae]QTI81840.1 ABC transporter permease [Roseomonas marmotae]